MSTNAKSFFQRVTAHPGRPWADPRENRLTAALSATIEHVPSLASRLASHLLDAEVVEPLLSVRTERPTGRGPIDLELLFGGSERRPARVLWVEVKHGSGLSGDDQLERYAEAQVERFPHSARHLVLLAPARFVGALEGPANATTWESVHRLISNEALRKEDVLSRWLLGEFARYLKEEGLDDVALTTQTVDALVVMDELHSALSRVMEGAYAQVGARWSGIPPKRKPQFGFGGGPYTYDAGETVRAARGGTGENHFEWGLGETEQYPTQLVFWAGLWSDSAGLLGTPTSERWISMLESADFGLEMAGRNNLWLMKTMEPGALLSEATVDAQAASLAEFVNAVFAAIASAVR